MRNVIIILMLGLVSNLHAQSSGFTNSEISKDFKFEGKNTTEEMIVEVGKGIDMIGFRIQGEIEQGELIISITDPNGKREGGFQLLSTKKESKSGTSESSSRNSSSRSNSESKEGVHRYTYTSTGGGKAHGSMMKQLDNPINGPWKIVIKAEKVIGKLGIIIGQQGK